MELQEVLETLFKLIILPLITLGGIYLKALIEAKIEEIKNKTNNDMVDKYLDMANDILVRCVIETTQTYVDELKKQGSFDKEAQMQAFNMTKEKFEEIATDELKNVIKTATNDYDAWVNATIETLVNKNK